MTLAVTASACTYTGDGSTQIFDVKSGSEGIYFETASELTVTLRSGDTITQQTISTHYTVSGAGSATGTITFLTAPADGIEVRIERNTAKTQTLNLTQAGAFSPPAIMSAFDKLTRITQDLSRGSSSGSDSGTHDGHPMTLDPSGDAWDAEDHIISNVSDGALPNDAVNYSQLLAVSLNAGQWALGNQTAVAGSALGVTFLLEDNDDPVRDLGGIWTGRVSVYAAISKLFDSSSLNDAGSPASAFMAYAVNNGAAGDVCALIGVSAASANGTTVFGGNAVALVHAGITAKAVGFEVDVQVGVGGTLSAGSIGIPINIFNVACPGPAIQTGQVGGGTWANGAVFYALASAGAAVSPGSGETMGSLLNSGTCTYTHDAIVLSNLHKLRFSGASSTHTKLYGDASSDLRAVMSGAVLFRDPTDATTLAKITSAGALLASDGSQTDPSFSFVGDPDTGMFHLATNTLGWGTGGTVRLGLTSTNFYPVTSGGVILGGASNPFAQLFLASTGYIDFANNDVRITHASNALGFTGASSGYTFDALISGTIGLLSGGSTDAVSLIVRQTSAGSPASNIFAVQNNGGTTNYLAIDPNGAMLVKGPSAGTTIVYDTTSSSAVIQYLFRDAGTDKFYLRKRTDNDFDLIDASSNIIFHGKAGGTMGIGTAAVTSAWLSIPAGTTAKSQIRMPSSTAPTSPVDDDVWWEGAALKRRVSGVTKSVTLT